MNKPVPYNMDSLVMFSEMDIYTIQRIARGMTLAEVYETYGVTSDDLNKNDDSFIKYNYRIGRLEGIDTATTELFKHMKQKGGAGVAMSYLIRFGDQWEVDDVADSDIAKSKSFRITFDT